MDKSKATNALFRNNHDQPRANSRFCDPVNYPFQSQTMLAQTIHFMKGVPFIYQGEEIGMTDPGFTSIDQYMDVESKNYYKIMLEEGKSEMEALKILQKKSRDNSRTPFQRTDGANAGFSSVKPRLGIADNYKEVNAKKALDDKSSIFYYYKKLIDLRKKEDIISDGSFKSCLEKDPDIFAYERTLGKSRLINLNNFRPKNVRVNLKDILKDVSGFSYLLGNYGPREISDTLNLRPYESLAFIKR